MENYTFLNKISIFAFAILSLISCEAHEDKLELNFERQAIGQVFSIADYCNEDFDSVYILHPYSNTEKTSFKNLKMSNSLRGVCNANVSFDSFSTLLFIYNGKVKAFSEIGVEQIHLTPPEIPENKYIFTFKQKFILDGNRYIHIYEE